MSSLLPAFLAFLPGTPLLGKRCSPNVLLFLLRWTLDSLKICTFQVEWIQVNWAPLSDEKCSPVCFCQEIRSGPGAKWVGPLLQHIKMTLAKSDKWCVRIMLHKKKIHTPTLIPKCNEWKCLLLRYSFSDSALSVFQNKSFKNCSDTSSKFDLISPILENKCKIWYWCDRLQKAWKDGAKELRQEGRKDLAPTTGAAFKHNKPSAETYVRNMRLRRDASVFFMQFDLPCSFNGG